MLKIIHLKMGPFLMHKILNLFKKYKPNPFSNTISNILGTFLGANPNTNPNIGKKKST
jgi:hypothetical protein